MLHRYWFRFEKLGHPSGLNLGCGVTAFDKADALTILIRCVFPQGLPVIEQCIEDIDVSALDQKHVAPNMGVVASRGIWFPLGFEFSA